MKVGHNRITHDLDCHDDHDLELQLAGQFGLASFFIIIIMFFVCVLSLVCESIMLPSCAIHRL